MIFNQNDDGDNTSECLDLEDAKNKSIETAASLEDMKKVASIQSNKKRASIKSSKKRASIQSNKKRASIGTNKTNVSKSPPKNDVIELLDDADEVMDNDSQREDDAGTWKSSDIEQTESEYASNDNSAHEKCSALPRGSSGLTIDVGPGCAAERPFSKVNKSKDGSVYCSGTVRSAGHMSEDVSMKQQIEEACKSDSDDSFDKTDSRYRVKMNTTSTRKCIEITNPARIRDSVNIRKSKKKITIDIGDKNDEDLTISLNPELYYFSKISFTMERREIKSAVDGKLVPLNDDHDKPPSSANVKKRKHDGKVRLKK